MQRTATLDEVHQNRWNVIGAGRDEHRSTWNALRKALANLLPDKLKRGKPRCILFGERGPAAIPDQHGCNKRGPDEDGHVAALEEFKDVGAKERYIKRQKESEKRARFPEWPLPNITG